MGFRTGFIAGLGLTAATALVAGAQEREEPEAEYWTNHLSFMVGGISATKEDLIDLTVGLEYEYRLNQTFGIGLVGETVFGEQIRDAVLGVPVSAHPWKGLRLVVAPLAELSDPTGSYKFKFGVRVGGDYEFEIGKWSVAPAVFVDIFEREPLIILAVAGGLFWQ